MANYTPAQLEQLWVQYGGNPKAAPMAAAIAMAESGGDPNATNHNTNSSIDRGLWQINSVHGAQSTFDIASNVKAAIAISNNGASWHPWSTYTNGAYQQFLGKVPGAAPSGSVPVRGSTLPSLPAPTVQQPQVDPSKGILAGYLKSSPGSVWETTKGGKDFGSSSGPLLSYLTAAQSNLQAIAGQTPLVAHPAVARQTTKNVGLSGIAGGFLPQGAKYVQGRKDQGRDGTTNAGGPIIAPGDGYVVRVGSDPGGFGPKYPIVHLTTGPYAGRTIYLGHTLAAVTQGSFRAGQPLSYTGAGPGGIGNATTPGWFEIGFADSGSPGPMGQPVPFN